MGWADVCYFFAMAILVLIILLPQYLSDRFLGYVLIQLYETLYAYHMPCEVVLLWVYFFNIAVVAMETVKMLKKLS